jgi:hypothetical protein
MIYAISADNANVTAVSPTSFFALSIWERRNIQEWIRKSPEILGEPLLILSMEFDRFSNSNDRLDLLALDEDGNLVVIELKRDSAAGLADLQAIRYAAMVSSMTVEMVLPYFVSYRAKYCGHQMSHTEARDEIRSFVKAEDFSELSSKPRIILCSEGFSPEITTTVLWLRQSSIDITCVKITPYHFNGQSVIVPNIIIPLQEAKEYLIEIQTKEEEQAQATRKNAPRTMKFLLDCGALKQGDRIFLKNGLPSWVKYSDSDPIFSATITGKDGQSNAVRWDVDSKEYAISNLTWTIFKDLHPDKKNPGGVNGNWHWVNDKGVTLWALAKELQGIA